MVKIGEGTTQAENESLLSLILEYKDVLAWTYDDLKAYKGDIIQHAIPLVEGAKLFRKKLRNINPKLAQIQKKLQNMIDARIIAPIRYSSWLSNLVVIRNKSRDIRLCVEFRNLNQLSLRDNYPIPNMEHLLQRVTCVRMMSMLDGFFGYNQVLVKKDDRLKNSFTTPWGTFMYLRTSSGLMNVGSTFQREIDFSFRDLIRKIIEIYQDDLMVVSKEINEHVSHLRKIFEHCRKYGISLNPKKSIFGVDKGKLLGHVVSEEGISIDLDRVEYIKKTAPPTNKKSLQSFFGKINFVRIFISNFTEKVKPMNALLKHDAIFMWDDDSIISFEDIKEAITTSHVLVSPGFSQDFIIFSFASQGTIARVLLQKNKDDYEQSIAFMIKILRDAEIKYSITEKQAYTLVKSLKNFRSYVGYNKINAYVHTLLSRMSSPNKITLELG
jgi:hypothetical protein